MRAAVLVVACPSVRLASHSHGDSHRIVPARSGGAVLYASVRCWQRCRGSADWHSTRRHHHPWRRPAGSRLPGFTPAQSRDPGRVYVAACVESLGEPIRTTPAERRAGTWRSVPRCAPTWLGGRRRCSSVRVLGSSCRGWQTTCGSPPRLRMPSRHRRLNRVQRGLLSAIRAGRLPASVVSRRSAPSTPFTALARVLALGRMGCPATCYPGTSGSGGARRPKASACTEFRRRLLASPTSIARPQRAAPLGAWSSMVRGRRQ